MTDKIQQARRKIFENDYVQYRQYLNRNKDGSYNEEWVDARWLGFNAALDCVVIAQPVNELISEDFARGVRSMIHAIESTNLGIKVK